MMKLFVPLTIYPKRRHIFPLLKPFEKGEDFLDADRVRGYGISEKELTIVDSMEVSDYVVLPMSWNFYMDTNSVKEVETVLKEAEKHHKKVLSFMIGDFGVKIPNYPNVQVFRNSGDVRRVPTTHLGLPVFIEDPLPKIFKSDVVFERAYQEKAVVGFCGQANTSLLNATKEIGKIVLRNVSSMLGLHKIPSQQLVSSTYVRAALLKRLEGSTAVVTNFIYRKKYRAGATQPEVRKRTTFQFYENMKDSDYVLCVRGAGNFSVRFYETLAMGRIPVFIDTNCLLPLSHIIDWKKHVVWVEYQDRNHVAEKINEFHSRLTSETFKQLQLDNRKLWHDTLQLGGFFKKFASSTSEAT
tara:strand:- start:3164 stop:4228 length:1065 start_codon:yes stop_codon:yes gene_type:complete